MASAPSAPQITPPTAETSIKKSFLHLPPEICNRIYRLSLTRQRTLVIAEYKLGKPELGNTSIFPAIVRTCRTTYREATAMLYGANKFSFRTLRTTKYFLEAIEPSFKYLQHMEINIVVGDEGHMKSALTVDDFLPLVEGKRLREVLKPCDRVGPRGFAEIGHEIQRLHNEKWGSDGDHQTLKWTV